MRDVFIGFSFVVALLSGMLLASFFDTTAEDFKEIKKSITKPVNCQMNCCKCRKDF